VNQAGVEKNSFRRRRFAGIDVRGDTDVARALQRILPIWRIDRFIFHDCTHLKF